MAQIHELRLTHPVISAYINLRIEEEGYNLLKVKVSTTSIAFDDPHVDIITERISTFQAQLKHNENDHAAMKEYSSWITKKLDDEEAHKRFDEILDEIFENRVVQWKRIFTALVFASKVAVKAMKHKNYERVIRYKEWCTNYFNTYVNHFIDHEGGWLPNTLSNIKAKKSRSRSVSSTTRNDD